MTAVDGMRDSSGQQQQHQDDDMDVNSEFNVP
jgi:hypothetical protein